MSFECNPCHRVATGTDAASIHFVRSHGPCETCVRTTETYECQCPGDWAKARSPRGTSPTTPKEATPVNQPDIKLHHIQRVSVTLNGDESYLQNTYGKYDLAGLARDGFFSEVTVDHYAGDGLQFSVASYGGEAFSRDIQPVTAQGFTNFSFSYSLASHLDRLAAGFNLPDGTYLTEREQQRIAEAAEKALGEALKLTLTHDGEEVAL